MKRVGLSRSGVIVVLGLLLAGCGQTSSDAPATENGVYAVDGICFGEGECFSQWRANAAVPLRERLDPASAVVTTVQPGEWVKTIRGQLRLVPLRGVVKRATEKPPLAVGDIVYMLEPLGEGYYVLWHKGKTHGPEWTASSEEEPITWDVKPAAAPAGAVLGWWVLLESENGKQGWVKDPSFECMGSLAGDADCRE